MPKDLSRKQTAAGRRTKRVGRYEVRLLGAVALLLALGGAWLAWGLAPPESPSSAPQSTPGGLPLVQTAPRASPTSPRVLVAGEGVGRPNPTQASPAPAQTPAQASRAEEDGRFAVLLLGYGGGGHGGALLTDSVMVAIVDPGQKTLTLLSMPRDAWVPLLFDGRQPVYGKLNTAYAYARDPHLHPERLPRYLGEHGAGRFASDTVARLLGIPIDAYVAFDFQGFVELIDAVGGVDVDVPSTFTAQYPRHSDPRVDPGWMLVHFQAGQEHMDGQRALVFARARLAVDNVAEGNDFARSRRQHLILTALKNKLLQPAGLARLPQLLAIAHQRGDSDYTLPSPSDLARLILAWKDVRVYQATLTTSNYMQVGTGPDDSYILLPRAPGASWAQIGAFARRLWADPALGQALGDTTVAVINRSGRPGLAKQVGDRLAALGYVVSGVADGSAVAQSILLDRSGGLAEPLLSSLARDLGLEASRTVVEPAGLRPQVVVELGQDAATQIVTDLPPSDREAPSSAWGVRIFGDWVPTVPTTTPTPAGTTLTAAGLTPSALPTQPGRTPSAASVTPTVGPKLATPTPKPAPTATPRKPGKPGRRTGG